MIKKGYYFKILRRFMDLKVTGRKNTMHLVVSSLARSFSFLLIPLAASKIVNSLELSDFYGTLAFILLFLASAVFFVTCQHYNYWAYYENANDIHNRLQQKILQKVTEFDTGFTANISPAALASMAYEDVRHVYRAPDYFCDTATHFLGIIINVVILCVVDFQIGMIATGLLIISMIIFVHHTKKRDYWRFMMREHADDISGLYSQIIDGYKEVQTMNLKEDLAEYLERSKESWKKTQRKQRFHRDFAAGAVPIVIGLGRVLIYLMLVGLILEGKYTIAALVLVLGYYEDIINRYSSICDALDNVSRGSVAIERIHRLLNFKTPHMLEFGEHTEDDIRGEVEFSHVYFTYDEPPKKTPDGKLIEIPLKKAPSLKDLSFKVEPMKMTAIVGKSGSGKSTIFRLLLRLYKITKGKILLDREDIYDYTKEVYATNVSIVTQRPFVFDMTIKENLDLVNNDEKAQIGICKMVGIHSDIMKLKDGYNTVLKRDGENLSAGQKQLLSLARTLLSRSEVLLFDEVTANLDAGTSDKIVAVLRKLSKSHTVLLITHRPELMRTADEILVIDKGRLVGQGTHKKLMKNNKIYRELQRRK